MVFLSSNSDNTLTRIIGITAVDISTTNGSYSDWGVLGLAYLNGRAGVVSTHRIIDSETDVLSIARFRKTITHELGHTLGLSHCSDRHCVMQDYKGTVKTLDASNGDYCHECVKFLRSHSLISILFRALAD